MTARYIKDHLFVENVGINNLIKKYPTPFYVYSTQTISETYKQLKKSLNKNIFYSVKANSNQSIISLLSKLGAGIDVVSGEELQRALAAKVDPKKIIFEGVGKTKDDITLAIISKIKQINIESFEELILVDKISKSLNMIANIGVRINPNIKAKTNNKISTGKKNDKFGISFNQLNDVIEKIHQLQNISLVGISCHVGSQIFAMDTFDKTFKKMKRAVKLFQQSGLIIKNLNLGGGMGIDNEKKQHFNMNQFSKIVGKHFNKEPYEISFEPGRFLVAKSGTLITKILMIKKSNNINFIIVDAGMNTFIRTALYNSYHNILPLKKDKCNSKYFIGGPICESSDVFAKNIFLPKQYIGNILAIQDVGAYGSVMSSNYNSKTLPAEVMIIKKLDKLIRPSQKISDLIEKDIIINW